MNNKNLLEVYNFDEKIRLGDNHDGGYVICEMKGTYDCYITCGISNEASFDRDFLNKYTYLNKSNSFGYDGTIVEYPSYYTDGITFIKKNIGVTNDENHSNLNHLIEKYTSIFLSIDIEGSEYPWLLSLTENKLKNFKQICIEFHGLTNDGWGSKYDDKIKCLELLNKTHYIMHAHGNNYGSIKNGIPDVLELTYINKDYFSQIPIKNTIPFPIEGLDYPNDLTKLDYKLDTYPFISNKSNGKINLINISLVLILLLIIIIGYYIVICL